MARFCTAEEKRQLTAMIEDIVACYEEMMAGEDWLGGYTAVILPFLFHLQSVLVPVLLYLLLSGRVVYFILWMFAF